MPAGSLDPVEELIQQTHQKIKTLGDLESVQEKPLASGVGIEYMEICPTPQQGRDGSSLAIAALLKIRRAQSGPNSN